MVVVNLGFVLVFQKSFCCLCCIITIDYLISIMWVWGWCFGVKGHSFILVFFFVIAGIHSLIFVLFVGFLVVGFLQECFLYCWRGWFILIIIFYWASFCSSYVLFVIIAAVIVVVWRSEVSIYFFVTVKVIQFHHCLPFLVISIFFIALVLTSFVFPSLLLYT